MVATVPALRIGDVWLTGGGRELPSCPKGTEAVAFNVTHVSARGSHRSRVQIPPDPSPAYGETVPSAKCVILSLRAGTTPWPNRGGREPTKYCRPARQSHASSNLVGATSPVCPRQAGSGRGLKDAKVGNTPSLGLQRGPSPDEPRAARTVQPGMASSPGLWGRRSRDGSVADYHPGSRTAWEYPMGSRVSGEKKGTG